MTRPKHSYRKGDQHQFQAEGAADGFAPLGNIDKPGPTKAWVQEEDGQLYVYVELEGDMNPQEMLGATGFERVT